MVILYPMLAKEFDPKHIKKWGSLYIQPKIDGCVSGDTQITLQKHGVITIKELHENWDIYKKDRIQSFNFKKNKVEYNEMAHVVRNGKDDNIKEYEWYLIETECGQEILITGNHRVWIPSLKCWRKVENLDGDEDFLLDK